MDISIKRYEEIFTEKVSIKHKVTEETEKKTFHLHEQVEIVFALSDNLKVRFEDRVVNIPRYSMLLLDSMNLHYIFSEKGSGTCDRYVLFFASDYVAHLSTPEVNLLQCFFVPKDERCVILRPPEPILGHYLKLLDYMEMLCRRIEDGEEEYGTNLQMQLLLALLLLLLNQLYDKQYGRHFLYDRENERMALEISEYIKKNYQLNFSVENLTRQFSISRTGLYTLFRDIFGMTVNEYITNCRIVRAKDLLINTEYSVEIISDMVGCSSISTFSRLFKIRTDMSPLKYRKKYSQ